MLPRKKRRLIVLILIILIILIIGVGFTLVYLNTDLFKSNRTLFMKYFSQNFDNISQMSSNLMQKNDYENSLEQSKYTVNTQINVNNTENLGTTEEDTSNVINRLKIVADGQIDKANQYEYQTMNLYKDDDSILGLEYVKDNNTYGIRFSDLFRQFLLVDNSNLQELFRKLGYTDEQITSLPNQIELNLPVEQLNITEQEKEELSERYTNIIRNGLLTQSFSKEQNQTIEIDGKSVQVNVYSVTLTKEQLNNLYLSLLEELKNDEIILGKLDTIQNMINEVEQLSEDLNTQSDTQSSTESLREIFLSEIDNIITQINQNNIGQDETRIIVYENMKNTVRTSIQTAEYEINLDFLSVDGQNFVQLSEDNSNNNMTRTISINKSDDKLEIEVSVVEGEEETNVTIQQNKEISGNMMTKTLSARYEDSDNRVDAYVTQNYQTVNQFDNEIVFDDENSIKLNELEQEELQSIMSTVEENVNGKISEIQTEVDMQEVRQVLINAKLLSEDENIQSTGTTETEKSRYNSQFEMLKGENLDADSILNALNASQDFISNIEVISNLELRIILSRNGNNPDVVTSLQNFIEEHNNENYNLDVGYDEETGLVSSFMLVINTDENRD